MMVDMSKVSWLSKARIDLEACELLSQWEIFTEKEIRPPIPVEAIAEKYLEFTLEYDDLEEMLGIPDALGATWAEEKRMVINHSLLDGVEGRIAFTCGHEIGHWMLHRKYLFDQMADFHRLCNNAEPAIVCRVSASKLRGEWQADYFSSCLLMPREEVENAYRRAFGADPISIYNEKSCFGRNNPVVLDPALDTVKEIARKVIGEGKFTNVSREAMCYRLNDLGLIINLTGKPLVTYPKHNKGIPPFSKLILTHKWDRWAQGDRMGGFTEIAPKSEIRISKSPDRIGTGETMTEIRSSNDPNPLYQVKCFEFETFEI